MYVTMVWRIRVEVGGSGWKRARAEDGSHGRGVSCARARRAPLGGRLVKVMYRHRYRWKFS